MTDAVTETTLVRLADGLYGYRAEDAYAALQARTPAAREAIDAALNDLVERGRLRREGARFYRPRGVL